MNRWKLSVWYQLLTLGILDAVDHLQCLDDDGNAVDWIYVYKLPKMNNQEEPVQSGFGYLYVTPNSGEKWTLSKKSLNDPESFLGHTLAPLYMREEFGKLMYGVYNDDPPGGHASSIYAHAKGVIMTNGSMGYWLVHSSPRFPEVEEPVTSTDEASSELDPLVYTFPTTATKFGQSFLCISLNADQMDIVGLQLQYMRPKMYGSNVPDELRKKFPQLSAAIDGSYIKTEPYYHTASLMSIGNVQFSSFAKSSKFNKDLYSDYVAPALSAPMEVETWSNGPGPLPSTFSGEQDVVNIKEVDITVNEQEMDFTQSKDHSKWAVTVGDPVHYICVGDINRMKSQLKRGGGTVCSSIEAVWKLYSEGVKAMEGFVIHMPPAVAPEPSTDTAGGGEVPSTRSRKKRSASRGQKKEDEKGTVGKTDGDTSPKKGQPRRRPSKPRRQTG